MRVNAAIKTDMGYCKGRGGRGRGGIRVVSCSSKSSRDPRNCDGKPRIENRVGNY